MLQVTQANSIPSGCQPIWTNVPGHFLEPEFLFLELLLGPHQHTDPPKPLKGCVPNSCRPGPVHTK